MATQRKKSQASAQKPKSGRPSDYKQEYAEQAYKLCLLSATDVEMADFFGVAESTIHLWKKAHPKFSESITRGKQIADAEIAESLYSRAKGYSHPDVHISAYEGSITKTDIIKHYPPDTQAASLWLRNRQPEKWRDKQEHDITTKGKSLNNTSDIDARITQLLGKAGIIDPIGAEGKEQA